MISLTLEQKDYTYVPAKFGKAKFSKSKFGLGEYSYNALTLESKNANATWNDETNSWANTPGTWASQGVIITLETKNNQVLSLEAKN